MNKTELAVVTCLALGAIALACLGCSYYQSRYFRSYAADEARIAQFSLAPRIFACQDEEIVLGDSTCDDYSITIRVREGAGETDADDWHQDPALVDSLSDAFLEKVAGIFRADSLLLVTQSGVEPIRLYPERDRYVPRRHNYFTLRFGSMDIPLQAGQLRLVLHVSLKNDSDTYLPDSLIWPMTPVDTTDYGLMMFRNNVRGYE